MSGGNQRGRQKKSDPESEKRKQARRTGRWAQIFGAQLAWMPVAAPSMPIAEVQIADESSQERRRRPAAPARTPGAVSLVTSPRETTDYRARIAEAVQSGVETVLGYDGGSADWGACLVYAMSTALVASVWTDRRHTWVIGSLYITTGVDRNVFGLDATRSHGTWTHGSSRGAEYHAWAVDGPMLPRSQFIDLSARHYGLFLERCARRYSHPGWQWQAPIPSYVWAPRTQLPTWLRLVPDMQATHEAVQHIASLENKEIIAIAGHALAVLNEG